MIHLGYVPSGGLAQIPFSTNASDGSAVTFTGTVSDVKVYKDGSTTERASTAGMTLSKDFDGVTGSHLLAMDLSDNTDAGFWASGSVYAVLMKAITVDSKTVSAWIGVFRIGVAAVNATQLNGTALTGRDIGASVLVSAGTGAGQLDLSSGVIKANLVQILGTALTETAGYLAAGFKNFFNVASPVATVASVDQTGDSYARIGAAGAGLTSLGDSRIGNLDAAVSSRSTFAGGAVASVTGNVGGSVASVAADVGITQAGADKVWSTSARSLTTFDTLIADVWAYLLTSIATAGSIGKLIKDYLNAAIDSRAAASTALTNATWTDARAGKLDNLDAAVTSRSTYAGADTAGTTTLLARVPGTVQPQTGDAYARLGAPAGASVSADVAAVKGDSAAIKGKTDNLPNMPAATGDIPTAMQNADALLARDWSSVSGEAARSVLNALRFLRNKVSISAGALTVTKEDDTTTAWVGTVTTDAAAEPITSIDPA